jgi:hypothetical protein
MRRHKSCNFFSRNRIEPAPAAPQQTIGEIRLVSEIGAMQSRTKFTPTAIMQIQRWLGEGLSADEIAARIGCTIGTLRVRCSQLGISLRCRKQSSDPVKNDANATRRSRTSAKHASSDPRGRLILSVRRGTLDQLRTYASSKGISGSRFAASLLEKIAEDDLYEAVLDDNPNCR